MKKAISVLAVLCLVFGMFTGCASSTQTSEALQTPSTSSTSDVAAEPQEASGVSEDETLVIALSEEPAAIMPTSASTANDTNTVGWCMTEPLFKWDETTGDIYPWLAESYEWIDDTHFRIKLREGVFFHNGEELTAEDVLYTFQVQTAVSAGASIYNLDNYYVEDKYNLVCETNGIWVQAPETYARNFTIYSKTVLEAQGGTGITDIMPKDGHGTGKYKFVEWVPGQYILLERNDNYWNQDEIPYYKYLKFVFVVDPAARAIAVESGDADVAANTPASVVSSYEGSGLDTHVVDTYMSGVVFMNMNNPSNPDSPLRNALVREAIWNLVDVDALNMLSARGMGTPNETTISPASIVYDAPPAGYERKVDVERAKELLAEAGYPDGFTLSTTNIPAYQAQLEIVQENLRLAGIDLQITINEAAAHFGLLRQGEYDMIYSSLNALYYTENIRLCDGRISYATTAGGCGYNLDEDYYELLDRAYEAFDMDERIAVYQEIQQYMRENYMMVGTHTTMLFQLARPGLSAPRITAAAQVDFTTIRPLEA